MPGARCAQPGAGCSPRGPWSLGARGQQVLHCSVLGHKELSMGDEGALPATQTLCAGGRDSEPGAHLAAVIQGFKGVTLAVRLCQHCGCSGLC